MQNTTVFHAVKQLNAPPHWPLHPWSAGKKGNVEIPVKMAAAEVEQQFWEKFVVDVMEGGVDNDLYSRAIAAYGKEALARIQSTKVTLSMPGP